MTMSIKHPMRATLFLLALAATVAQAAPVAPAAAAKAPPGRPGTSIRVLVAASQESVLASQMAGRIDRLTVQLGSTMRAGQALLQFNCEEKEAYLKMANAEFYSARRTYESKVKLQAMQSVSELEVTQAAAATEKFKAQILLYQAQLKQCTVAAPFSGRVTRLHVKPFESVNIGQPLIDIVNSDKFKLQLNVPSVWLSALSAKTRFTITVDENGHTYNAQVTRINGKVDPVSRSVEVEGEVIGPTTGLLPGMSGVAVFPGMPAL
jgi:membrane fusion protein (multidrug efflux system)